MNGVKKTIIIILILVILIIAFIFLRYLLSEKVKITSETAVLHYELVGGNVHTELTADETRLIKSIFNGKRLYRDYPACPFDKKVSIEIDGVFFCIAFDGCNIVNPVDNANLTENPDLYFTVSRKQKNEIAAIFEKYCGDIDVFH